MPREELSWREFGTEVLSGFYWFIGIQVSGSNRVSSSGSKINDVTRVS